MNPGLANLVGLCISVLMAAGSLAAADPAGTAPPTTAANAADSYRQAAKFMEVLQSSRAESAQLGRYERGQFDAQAGAFFARHEQIIALVRAGASMPACDWGQPQMESRLPTLNQLRSIANLCLTRARFLRQQKQPVAALDDALTAMALARHIGAEPLLIDKLVEIGIESAAIAAVAGNLPSLPPEQLKLLPQRLDALPKSTSGQELMLGELAYAKRSIREQQGGLIPIAMADSLEGFYQALGAAMDQPPDEFAKTVDAEMAKFKLNSFAQISGPSFKRAREPIAALQARRAMLQAAIQVARDGEPAVAASHDPFNDGKPFGFAKTASGFVLTSKLTSRAEPVKLTVGGQ